MNGLSVYVIKTLMLVDLRITIPNSSPVTSDGISVQGNQLGTPIS